jgi:YidC/Oxa1 family membrane protein insertase
VIAIAWWQSILNALGAVLAALYNLVPNYGVAIILLTIAIRIVLLPLGIKQIRSMQAMQVIQPKLKQIQQKYKGNRQKIQEEQMALYKQYGVNPLGGCLPLLLQFPVLIALYGVLQFPKGLPHIPHSNPNPVVGVPQDSRLYVDIVHQKVTFLGANLVCSAQEAGQQVKVDQKRTHVPDAPKVLDCGKGGASRIPYYAFALVMIATTYYQQRQMQKAQPPGASSQQQALTKVMPLLFGVWGFLFPAGLVIYWTTTNLIQIGQQHFMLPKKGSDEEPGTSRATGDGRGSRNAGPRTSRPQGGAGGGSGRQGRPGGSGARPLGAGGAKGGRTGRPDGSKGGDGRGAKAGDGRTEGKAGGGSGGGGQGRSPGGRDGGDRKKRRKR